MAVTIEQVNDKQCRVVVTGEMTIYVAMELKASLIPALDKYQEMVVDLAGVTEIDTSGLQLLVLLKTEAKAHGKTLSMTEHSPAVLEVLSLCDLESFFGDPVVISSQV